MYGKKTMIKHFRVKIRIMPIRVSVWLLYSRLTSTQRPGEKDFLH